MATQREIKRRIASVKNTQQITRAMKMVSAAKLRKYQQKLIQLRPYSEELFRMVSELSSSSLVARHSFFTDRNVNKVCYVLMTADRGLCGSFNTNLIRTVSHNYLKA